MAHKKCPSKYVMLNACFGTTFCKMPFHEKLFLGKSYLRDVGCTNPECGEILSHDKAGHREVHVKDHWVIIYRMDCKTRTIVIVKVGRHEKVLGR
jgi:hypothetical protein